MDPTAQENNDQNTQNPQATSPIQPGQFVVATDESVNVNGQATAAPAPPNVPAPNQPLVATQPAPASPLPPPAPGDGFTTNSIADSSLQAQNPLPPPPVQPDPTPFAPPPQPVNPTAQPGGGDSKFGKVKIIGIAAGVISLLVIIVALVWFFVIKGKTVQTPPATSQIIEESSPSAAPAAGFGQINESTPEASSQASPASSQSP